MRNILASTTRQWNCGDEFILFGCQNLVESVIDEPLNWVIFNRNPDIMAKRPKGIYENSFYNRSLKYFQHIVIAGSPEWFGGPLKPLFETLDKEKRRAIFLGVGYIKNRMPFSKLDKDVLSKARFISTRDNFAKEGIEAIGLKAEKLPCPALFASKTHSVKKGKKIGCVWQYHKMTNQRVSEELSTKTRDLYKTLEKELGATVICHYIDEFMHANDSFSRVEYSYDSRDYLKIYDQFDIIISTRLHGALLALSLGIPAILVVKGGNDESNQTQRCSAAAAQFPSLIVCTADKLMRTISELKTQEKSKEICAKKESAFENYRKILKGAACF